MKILYCAGCNQKVAEIESGSRLKKGMVVLCENCETKHKASDLARANTNINTSTSNMFNDIFSGEL